MNKLILAIAVAFFATSCSVQKAINKTADSILFKDSALANAHIGISIFDASNNKYLYDHQGNKFFVPASNTKIFTCYAALKYFGDSIPGIQYVETADSIYLFPTGDPTFLHKDFATQPIITFLNKKQKPIAVSNANWNDSGLGFGWSWDDYNSSYMAERSPLPVYGNIIRFVQEQTITEGKEEPVIYTIPDINWKLNFNPDPGTKAFSVRRQRNDNIFRVTTGTEKYREQEIPFITNGLESSLELLKDTVRSPLSPTTTKPKTLNSKLETIHSQPTDSLLIPMMHNSDNFFAEQILLMVSNIKLGVMDDSRLIDTLLKTDLAGLPQKPRWVDGSGLSRYNLFSPQDFVWVLNRMKMEFPFERIKHIFATGGQGTLRNFYKTDSANLFAKTGSLSGHLALSGFVTTRKNKQLIFSVIVNNHNGSAVAIRRQVERFLQGIIRKY
jgi:serine-type D-Ala-D-Ala carboxypeptidase/endopeptidase (penicillin-binding protein 4)